jgi:hypothetical protein
VTLPGGRVPRLYAVVPGSLLHGDALVYYAVIRDTSTGHPVRTPTGRSWVLHQPTLVRLGTHAFGHTRAPEAVVARAAPGDVTFQTQGDPFGPQTFVVGADRSVWVLDGLGQRLLVWKAGRPGTIARRVPLPHPAPDTDFALGPSGSIYDAWWDASKQQLFLDRLTAAGKTMWTSLLASPTTNAPLRTAPDGSLDAVNGMPGALGAERGWTPIATPAGRPLGVAVQQRLLGWPFQPVAGGLRLLVSLRSTREMRVALVDRADRVVRSWRIVSRTTIEPGNNVPALVGGDPVLVLDVTKGSGEAGTFRWEYEVLKLSKSGTSDRFSLRRTVYGDNLLADVRVGPDGRIYRLGSSPQTGVTIDRFSLR